MRTTLNLDDDIFQEVKEYADSRSVALGRAVSELVRLGLHAPMQTQVINGIHVVVLLDTNVLIAMAWPTHTAHAHTQH